MIQRFLQSILYLSQIVLRATLFLIYAVAVWTHTAYIYVKSQREYTYKAPQLETGWEKVDV